MDMANKAECIARELHKRMAGMNCGEKLPSESQLVREFGIAKMTAAHVLNLLVQQHLADRIPGRGTFVAKQRHQTINVIGGNVSFFDVLNSLIMKRFPDVSLKRSVDPNAELIRAVTNMPFAYETMFAPLPDEMIFRLKSEGRFFPFAFDIHAQGGLIYGIPAFFSPVVVAWNRNLMRRIEPHFEPRMLTQESFPVLCRKAREQGWNGFGDIYSRLLITTAILAAAMLRNDDTVVNRALELVLPWFQYRVPHENFTSGQTLFEFLPRNRLQYYMGQGIDFELAPFPSFFNQKVLPFISESLCVGRQAQNKEKFFKICEYTLSPEFQQAMCNIYQGLSVDRTITVSLMEIRSYRDDFYFTGLNQIRLMNYFFPAAFNRELHLLYDSFQQNSISGEDFRRELEQRYKEIMRKEENTQKLWVNMHNLLQE